MYFITTKRMLEVCFFQHTPTFIIEPNKNTIRKTDGVFYGPDRIRTDDPHNANVVRSQLRYKPVYEIVRCLKSLNGLIIAPKEDYVKNF